MRRWRKKSKNLISKVKIQKSFQNCSNQNLISYEIWLCCLDISCNYYLVNVVKWISPVCSLFNAKKFTLPQKFFGHFYAVSVVWTTFLLVTTWLYAYKTVPLVSKPFHYTTIANQLAGGSHIFSWLNKSRSTSMEYKYGVWQSVFLLLLMEVQVLRRLFETIYVFNYSPSARMHIIGYLTGLL